MTEITEEFLKKILLWRINDSHKANYGHLLIIAGCQNMPGAAVLATTAALQSGCGLVTLHSTERALDSAAVNCPSAMLSYNPGNCISEMPANMDKYSAICIGPGIGQSPETSNVLSNILTFSKSSGIPLLIDADALNLLAKKPDEMVNIGEWSILTPHPGELRRLFKGMESLDDNIFHNTGKLPEVKESIGEKDKNNSSSYSANTPIENAIFDLCKVTNSTIIAKGYLSKVFSPSGKIFKNSTGGPGLAKAGSGDVLSGLTAGLMARGYIGVNAALLGTWIHGKAGDILSEQRTMESFSSFDLANNLFQAFKLLYQ